MLIEWKDSYRTGMDEVDHEHRELIDIINRLFQQLNAPEASLSTPAFFGDLNRAITAHFALEERHMRDRGYDQLPEHKGDHERLLDELRDLMDEYEAMPANARASVLGQALDEWFSIHFRTHDSRLHRALGPHPHD
jgi:hemerythrin-like metal-binding protein